MGRREGREARKAGEEKTDKTLFRQSRESRIRDELRKRGGKEVGSQATNERRWIKVRCSKGKKKKGKGDKKKKVTELFKNSVLRGRR